ncbi:hypothetical protein GOP47_0012667 [Adiantum capillus-veneris]|uniref:TOM1-like protein 2 n=1 Tax=Adiantum capillus-veneris TaxID=13818 RepID=A0A9D4URC3_ADICA|nr:hypothetical protein GOP47_0012667 [Adiantum capillus-veneris]
MSDAFMDKLNSVGERIKVGGAGLSRKMSAGVSSMSGRMKELFQVPSPMDRQIEEATSETMEGPDWEKNMLICDMVNHDPSCGVDVVRSLKKRLALNTRSPHVQILTLSLLETCVKNCEKMFSEVASERVLDEIVKAVDDPLTATHVRQKILTLVEAWGEATDELRYLPVFEETYKAADSNELFRLHAIVVIIVESLKSRGIRFPGRDAESLAPIFTPPRAIPPEFMISETTETGALPNYSDFTPEQPKEILDVARNAVELLSTVLTSSPQQEVLKDELTSTLVEQCRQSQTKVQRFIERGADDEQLLFEALNVNDELQQVLNKFEEMSTSTVVRSNQPSEPALIPVGVVDEEEPVGGAENGLIRKSSAKPSAFRGMQGDEAAMADLDNMIFGQTGSSQENSQGAKKKKTDDLIVF